MSDPLEFSVRINLEDYVDWSRFLQKHRKAPPAKGRLMLWFACAVFGFALFWLFDWAIDWIVKEASSDCDVQIPKEDLALLALAPVFCQSARKFDPLSASNIDPFVALIVTEGGRSPTGVTMSAAA